MTLVDCDGDSGVLLKLSGTIVNGTMLMAASREFCSNNVNVTNMIEQVLSILYVRVGNGCCPGMRCYAVQLTICRRSEVAIQLPLQP